MVHQSEAWYVGQRAESLAIVLLTRRADLIVDHSPNPVGLDLMVTIGNEGTLTAKLFGVQLKGVQSKQVRPKNGGYVVPLKDADWEHFRAAAFPICLFVFDIENNHGYYRWIRKPMSRSQSRSLLEFNPDSSLALLDDQALDAIVREVDAWYDVSQR